ncbi:MAG: gluconolactonase [Kiritimatiellia bacterium]|jgi:gluconolactonase
MKVWMCMLFFAAGAYAGSLVDPASPLEKIPGEFELADGPSWDGRSLLLPDVKGGKLYRYIPSKKEMQVLLPDAGRISATFFNHGKLYLSDNGESRIAWLKGRGKVSIAGQDPEAKPPNRPNDLVVDKHGGVYYTLTRTAQVVYIHPDGTQEIAVEGIETANGITLSPDGSTLYVAAYKPKEIWAYTISEPGKAIDPRRFAAMDDGAALGADGMCIDRAGNVYCAGAKHVWVWSPSGTLLDQIECPERPINCAFGDQDLRSLYITGFGGLYRQRMLTYGLPGRRPSVEGPLSIAESASRPSTIIPASIKADIDVVYREDGDRKLLADIYSPRGDGPFPGIIAVHGGGWLNSYKDKFTALGIALAERGYVTMVIEYRLGHEATFPVGIHDCNAATRFLRTQANRYHVDAQRIGAVGGSAGGHLAGLMATGWDVPGLEGEILQAAIVMAGPMEITTGAVAERSMKSPADANINAWTGKSMEDGRALYELADAHRHISKGDPPILFMAGEHDKPERNAPSREALTTLGIPTGIHSYKDGKHGCWNQLPWFNDMVADMDDWFNAQLK